MQIESYPKNLQLIRHNPEITSQAHQPTVLRSLQLRAGLTAWIAHYNTERSHSALPRRTPEEAYHDTLSKRRHNNNRLSLIQNPKPSEQTGPPL
ncbi:transposase [Gluconobacter cerinus]|uniref:integrase core domain-containing protein n=1 Tax=Gluconobacter cerinus TaxID=38307 RepID=UPI001B8BFD98|nr:transposase [Gluconobacter cerinus]MBS1046595.1 transposase [Gluconobacter cerinus]